MSIFGGAPYVQISILFHFRKWQLKADLFSYSSLLPIAYAKSYAAAKVCLRNPKKMTRLKILKKSIFRKFFSKFKSNLRKNRQILNKNFPLAPASWAGPRGHGRWSDFLVVKEDFLIHMLSLYRKFMKKATAVKEAFVNKFAMIIQSLVACCRPHDGCLGP